MRNLSVAARIVMVSLAVLGTFAFLVIAELGVNAGLIHYGVKVGHVDVGGMTPLAAERAIEEAGEEMASTPIVFAGGGLGPYAWTPSELEWEPRKFEMSARAMKVGRKDNIFHSLGDRIAAWTKGVEIRWHRATRPTRRMVRRAVGTVAQEAEVLGLTVDKPAMRRLLRGATREWPRASFYAIPFES